MTAELIALTDELRAVNAMLGKVTERLDRADRQHRRHRAGTFVLAVVVAAVVLLGWRDLNQYETDREAQCESANGTRAEIRAAIVETVLVIVQEMDDPASLAPLVERIHDRLETTIPDRECS